jgi:hypothetical protein
MLSRFRLATPALSLGGVETLVCLPSQTSHRAMSPEDRRKAGISPGLVRVSVRHLRTLRICWQISNKPLLVQRGEPRNTENANEKGTSAKVIDGHNQRMNSNGWRNFLLLIPLFPFVLFGPFVVDSFVYLAYSRFTILRSHAAVAKLSEGDTILPSALL